MDSKLLKILIDLNLICTKNTTEENYAWQPDARHELELVRFLNNQAYWRISSGQEEPKFKNILLNDYHLSFSEYHGLETAEVLAFLIHQGFRLYLRTGPGKFEIIDSIERLREKDIRKVQFTENETILTELQTINEKPEDFFIYDNETNTHIINGLAPYCRTQYESLGSRELTQKNLHLNRQQALSLTDNNIDFLSHLASKQIITSIGFSDYECQNHFSFNYDTTSDPQETKSFLQQIRDAAQPGITGSWSFLPYATASYISLTDPWATDLNLEEFTRLRSIDIGNGYIVHINGLKKQRGLKELYLLSNAAINFKSVDFPFLEDLTLRLYDQQGLQTTLQDGVFKKLSLYSKYSPVDFRVLETCKNLNDLTICPHPMTALDLNLSALCNLRKLELFYNFSSANIIADPVNTGIPLEELRIYGEDKIRSQVNIPHPLQNLKTLSLLNVTIEDLNKLLMEYPNLEELSLRHVDNIKALDLSGMRKLKILNIDSCASLASVSGLQECTQLENVHIMSSQKVDGVNLASNERLKEINLQCRNSTIVLPHDPRQVKDVHIMNMDVNELDFANYINLEHLTLFNARINEIRNLGHCEKLRVIYFHNASGIQSLDIKNNIALKELRIEDCDDIETLYGLAQLPEIMHIRITNCKKLTLPADFDGKSVLRCTIEIPYREVHHLLFDAYHYRDIDTEKKITLPPPPIIYSNALLLQRLKRTHDQDSSTDTNLRCDDNTYTPPGAENTVQKIFSDSAFFKPEVCHYRNCVYDHFEYSADEGPVIKAANFNQSLEAITPTGIIIKEQCSTGSLIGEFVPGRDYTLPGLSTNDELSAISPDLFDSGKSRMTDQLVVRLKNTVHEPVNCTLRYTVNKDRNYLYQSLPSDAEIDTNAPVPALPNDLRAALNELFSSNELLKIIKTSTSREEQIRALISYCHFSNADLSKRGQGPLKQFILMLNERKGCCRHSARAFMALCHYLRLPARIVGNDCHEYVETPIMTQQGRKWIGIDLGGAPTKLDVHEPGPIPLWLDLTREPVEFTPEIKKFKPAPPPIDERYLPYFLPNDNYLAGCATFRDAVHRLLSQEKAVLFRSQNSHDAWAYYHALYRIYQEQNLPFVLIDSVDDLKALFYPVQIHDTREQSEFLYSRVDGPIRQLLLTRQGALFINWENFSAHDKALYKSIIDDPPTLNGMPVPAKVRVFGILPQDRHANDVFLSRNFTIKLKGPLMPREVNTGKNQADGGVITKNLYHGRDWKSVLINEFIPQGDSMHIEPGMLLAAMENGTPLALVNAPDDPELARIIERVNTEHKLFANGKWVYAKPGFRLQLREEAMRLIAPENIIFDKDNKTNGQAFHINSGNFESLFRQYHIDETGRIFVMDGWLKGIRPDDKIIVTCTLKDEQWQRLYDHMKNLNPPKALHVYQSPKQSPSLNAPAGNINSILSKGHNLHIETNDTQFVTQLIQQRRAIQTENIFYLSNGNAWTDLIEDVKLEIANHQLRARRTEGAIFQKLKRGEDIILCGNMTEQEYAAIQTLFCQPAYLYVNGNREKITGRVIWVSQPQSHLERNGLYESCSVQVDINDYEAALRLELPDVIYPDRLKRLKLYFQHLNQCDTKDTTSPAAEQYTYAKFREMYLALVRHAQADNPLKSVTQYFYIKNTENYARVNVLAKTFLSENTQNVARRKKLKKLLYAIHSGDEFDAHFWRLFNCFGAGFLKQLKLKTEFENNTTNSIRLLQHLCNLFPRLKTEAWVTNKLAAASAMAMDVDFSFKPPVNRFHKQKRRLVDAINDPAHPLIYLLGDSGTGKTHTAKRLCRKLANVDFYSSQNKIAKWLTPAADGKIKVLLLDEANLAPHDSWEFLRGLFQKPPIIYYRGKSYLLSGQHKVILTGNPLYYPDRHFQKITWEYANVIWFAPFEKKFVKAKITHYLSRIDPAFCLNHDVHSISQRLYHAYHYLEASNERLAEITLRDIENICARLVLLQLNWRERSLVTNLAQAIYTEMKSILLNKQARDKFREYLQETCAPLPKITPAHYHDNEIVIPPGKEKLWSIINEDLALRQMRIDKAHNKPGKLGLLLQGPSGIGKTKLFLRALEHQGFTKMAFPVPEGTPPFHSQRVYYQITAGSEDTRAILLKAFHEGSVVVLDELNLDPELEDLLNQLLCGIDPEGHKARMPGFMLLASQNPAYYDGCQSLSRALLNRLHIVDMKDYTAADLTFIAAARNIPRPQLFTNTFFFSKNQHPDEVNTRNCFHAMLALKGIRP